MIEVTIIGHVGNDAVVKDFNGKEEEHEVDMEAWKKGFQKFIEDDATDYADLMNERCQTCAHGRNCINGRWCEKLRKYVQYNKKPLCEDGN